MNQHNVFETWRNLCTISCSHDTKPIFETIFNDKNSDACPFSSENKPILPHKANLCRTLSERNVDLSLPEKSQLILGSSHGDPSNPFRNLTLDDFAITESEH